MGGIDANIAAEEILLHADLKNESTEIAVDISADRIALSAEIELQEKEISADIESAQPEIAGNLPGKLVFYVNGGEIEPSSGGYYVPAVHQIDDSTMEISFDASKESMPDVAPVPITLPSGPPGPEGKTPEVRIKLATQVNSNGTTRHGVSISGPKIVNEETGATVSNSGIVWDGLDGKPGTDGITPHIGENGNWFIGEDDTGVPATGPAGNQGLPGKDGEDGYTPVKGVDYFDGQPGADGKPGADGQPGKD